MTYRERRMRKAERLRGWADGREARGQATLDGVQEMCDAVPMGQPILVGHYSEGPMRRHYERIDAGMRRGIADQEKAEEMRERADNIERAAAQAIYSDDPDAIEALQAKIERLEAERARIVAYNKSCRAARRADPASTHGDLSILDEEQKRDLLGLIRIDSVRDDGSFPSYKTSNLGGTINATRKRLAVLSARAARRARAEGAV